MIRNPDMTEIDDLGTPIHLSQLDRLFFDMALLIDLMRARLGPNMTNVETGLIERIRKGMAELQE